MVTVTAVTADDTGGQAQTAPPAALAVSKDSTSRVRPRTVTVNGHVVPMSRAAALEIPRPIVRSSRTFGLDGRLRIVQLTDLHIMDIERAFAGTDVPQAWAASVGDSAACLERTLNLVREIVSSQSVDIAVLTGNIVDPRGVNTLDVFLRAFRPLACTLLQMRVPWLYLPGNHEDGHGEAIARAELSKVLCLPGSLCRPGSLTSFDQTHALPITPDDDDFGVPSSLLLQLVDARWSAGDSFVSKAQVRDVRRSLKRALWQSPGRVLGKLAFAHEPFDVFRDTEIPLVRGSKEEGQSCRVDDAERPCGPLEDSGYIAFLRAQGFHGLFVGHDHHNDFVRWSGEEEPWFGYGRCGSFFPPTTDGPGLLPFRRGARVFEVDTIRRALSTWVYEEHKGVLEASRLVRHL
eukprot:TRINITY_DN25649_c0_g2_i1.p1 TRINITY_DN25649_c0_g2~~TRINITY_DN25649_c0_g2_i1.p1  ORF type:complete len:471 (+),score=57.41 TRINITY_DN25649_c0_g2_i1:199-1413(+)